MDSLLTPEIQLFLVLASVLFLSISFFNPTFGLILMTFAMLFSPEFNVGSIGEMRELTLRMEDVLIPLLLIAWLARLAIRQEFRLIVASPLNIPMLAILAISIFSSVRGAAIGTVSSLPTAIFYILKVAEFFTLYFLVLSSARTEKSIRRFIIFIILVVALVGIYTLFQVPKVEIFSTNRITAPFEGNPEPATIGGYMAFLLLIVISLFLYERKLAIKLLYGVIGTLVFIPFLYTLNRTSYLALLAGLVFIAIIEKKRKRLIFFLFAFLALSPLLAPQAVKDRIAWMWKDASNPGREIGVDASMQQRLYAFTKLYYIWKDGPLIGLGVCSWSLPDNQYARTLAEIGLIGLGLWIWIFMRLFRMSKWLFEYYENGMMKGFLLGYRAGLVAIAMHGFGAITLYIVRIMEPFWFVSGLVVSLYLIKVQEPEPVMDELTEDEPPEDELPEDESPQEIPA